MKREYLELLWFITGVLGVIALFLLFNYMDLVGSARSIKSIAGVVFIIPIGCIIIVNTFIKKIITKIFNTNKYNDILDIVSIQVFFVMFIIFFKLSPGFLKIIDIILNF